MISRPSSRRFFLLLAAIALVASACGGSGDYAACNQPFREQLDPNGQLHPTTAEGITFLSNPPTSGPHTEWFAPPGFAIDSEMNPLIQIGVLEAGLVLVQYHDLDPALETAVRDAGTRSIMVAPNSTLDDPVVATATQWKLTCPSVTADNIDEVTTDIATFAAARAADPDAPRPPG